jgi:hypothetical protein
MGNHSRCNQHSPINRNALQNFTRDCIDFKEGTPLGVVEISDQSMLKQEAESKSTSKQVPTELALVL